MASLEDRLANLERRNEHLETRDRRWKRSAFAVAAAAGVALLSGQAAAPKEKDKDKAGDALKVKSVTAESFTVIDADGKTRLEIGVDKNGGGVSLRDARGKYRVVLGEGTIEGLGEGAGLWVFDDRERPRVGLGIGKHGSGLLVLDENGKPVAGEGKGK